MSDKKYSLITATSMGVRITPTMRQPVGIGNTYMMQATSAESNVLNVSASLGLETLALTVSAGGLKSAVKRAREPPLIRLPNGTYYIFEAGNYSDGLQITFS